MLTYYRYRLSFSSGPNEWGYGERFKDKDPLLDEDILYELGQELSSDWRNEEGYRGVEIEDLPTPPLVWVDDQIARSSKLIAYHQRRLQRLQALRENDDVKDPGPQ